MCPIWMGFFLKKDLDSRNINMCILKKCFGKILKISEIFKIYIFLHHKWSQSSISKFILSIWYTLYNFCFFFLTWREIIFREEVRNSILGYPSLKNKNFGTFLGEIYRINPEILGYPRIPGYPLTTSLWFFDVMILKIIRIKI